MREAALSVMQCPRCTGTKFKLKKAKQNHSEIRSGFVLCEGCGKRFPIKKGIASFLNPQALEKNLLIKDEICGWRQHFQKLPQEKKVSWLLSLPRPDPSNPKSMWTAAANNFDYALGKLGLHGGETILEIGAGRCWASAKFAEKCNCFALDIVADKFIGLESADVLIKNKGVFFERIQADMHCLPFKKDSFDMVFSTASVHHSSNITKLFSEISRVLKKNGRFVAINEPLRGLLQNKKIEKSELGINENAYNLLQYRTALERAGFSKQVLISRTLDAFLENKPAIVKIAAKQYYGTMRLLFGLGDFQIIAKK